MLAPAPYPEVNTLLGELLDNVRTLLGPHLIGVYLFGSLAAGDFDAASDVDVLVVTGEALTDAEFSTLQAMHDRLALGDSPWATQLEVSYISKAALRRFDPSDNRHPHLDRDKGQRLHIVHHDVSWVVQRHVLRECGAVLAGPAPETLIDPVSPDDLRAAMRPVFQLWARPMLNAPVPFTHRGYQSYTVLSICRMLYTLQHGAVVSKPTAARWALATWDPRWRGLIERALEGRHKPDSEAPATDVNETLDLIRATLDGTLPFA